MSNLDEVSQKIEKKFARALNDEHVPVMPFVRLALFEQQVVFEAILYQRQATIEGQRQHEAMQAQMGRMNEWLLKYAPSRYYDAQEDTATAMIGEANCLRAQIILLNREIAAAVDERNFADRKCAELEQQILNMDAASLTMNGAANDYRIGLEAGRWAWRDVPKAIRLELVRSVIASTPNRTQAEFDAVRPGYMATATAHAQAFGMKWSELGDLEKEIEVTL